MSWAKLPFLLAGFALVMSVLACSLPVPFSNAPVTTTTEPSPLSTTVVPPTPTSVSLPGGTDFLPSGFVTTDNSGRVLFHDVEGSLTGVVLPAGFVTRAAFHVAGPTSADLPPLIYFIWRETDPVMVENASGVETVLFSQPDFFRLLGVPRMPYFAYSTATYTDTGLLTRLYFGKTTTIATATPVLELLDPDGYAIKPLAFRMQGGMPDGIYFTGCLYGIGGDLPFDPCNRLRLLDLNTGSVIEILGDGYNPSGFSPDGRWVAYAALAGGGPLQILNLDTGATRTFSVWPLNDRGAGDAVFSPDGRYVAWMEARGYLLDEPITFQTNLRIAEIEGSMNAQYLDDYFEPAVGFPTLSAIPVGWLDNDSLLVQVSGFETGQSALVRFDLDTQEALLLTSGYFLALTYP